MAPVGTYFLAANAAILGPLNGEYLVMRALTSDVRTSSSSASIFRGRMSIR